jgi:flagellar biosynthetic protein FlhB
MQREIATRKVVEKTKQATVLITNPTHYSIAIKYEMGMGAPVVLAKGIDHLALKMREIAKEADIPIVENRPLARAIYADVDEDQEIPDTMFKAVSEIIRYVFKLKGIKIGKKSA